ncbi:MAG TPA: hypothetical protein P5058_06905, partial [Eubacteriales bacterium]|nr:hypothetical protein [Eubacteriales bacterium]
TITAVEPEDSLFDNYGLAPGEVTITGFEMQKLVSSYKWYIANSQISSGAYLPYEGNASGEYLATTGYNGYAWTVKPNVNNLASGDTQSSFTYTYGSGTYSATAAGNYTATLTGWNNSNYTLTGTTSFDWVIHARVLNVNPVAGAWDISKIYDGTNFYRYSDDTYPTTVANPLQFTLNTHYTVSPADPSLGVVSIDIDIREALFTGINAGLYTNNVRVYYMLYAQDENNYVIEDASGAGYISFTGTILPKQLSATWQTPSSFPYNGVQQGYTPNIIGRVTVSGTVDNVNFVLTGNVATNAGNYTCTITGLSGSKSANYIMPIPSECSGSWSITKISRAVQWSALSVFTYNSQNQGNSVTAWIIGAGDDGNLSLNVTFSGKATTFREAGSYTATASAGATPAELVNYIITAPLTKALTMNSALVVFNWSGSLTPVYNATARTVTATVAASSVFGSDVVTVTAYNNTGTQVAGSSPARYYHNSATDAAYYRAEVTGISNPNYTFTTAATRYVDWRISPAALRLTANNQTFV